MSAILRLSRHPESRHDRSGVEVCFGLLPDSCAAANGISHLYSITSVARTRIEGGTVRPSALAVFMLMISSNLVGCSTGRSAGLVPLRILST